MILSQVRISYLATPLVSLSGSLDASYFPRLQGNLNLNWGTKKFVVTFPSTF